MDTRLSALIRPTEALKIDRNSDIEDLLQCPVCYEICIPPIYICISGHSLCKTCKTRVQGKCPLCRQQVKDGRNFSLEALYNVTQFACVYKQQAGQGCSESVRGDQFQQHVTICPFRPYNCCFERFDPCKTNGVMINFNYIYAHLLREHKVQPLPVGHYCSHDEPLLPGDNVPLVCWNFEGNSLFLERLLIKNNLIYINILFLGEKCEAEKYKVDLHIIRKGLDCAPNILKAIHPMPVNSVRESFEEVKKDSIGYSETVFKDEVARIDLQSQRFQWMTRVDIKKISQSMGNNSYDNTSELMQGQTMNSV